MPQGEAYDVVLAASYAQAKNWNRAHALACENGAFDQVAQTFDAWIEKLWEQNGDGRRLVSRLEASLAAQLVVAQHSFVVLEPTSGLPQALCECARKGFGVPLFDRAVAEAANGMAPCQFDAGDFTPPEVEVLRCVAEYARVLDEHGLVELGGALRYLSDHASEVFPHDITVRVLGDDPLNAQQQAFFESVPAVKVVHDELLDPPALDRAPVQDVRLALPAGRYAQAGLLLDVIGDALEGAATDAGGVVISSAYPLELYEKLAPALAEQGISCSVQDQLRFVDTDFGKAYIAARDARVPTVPWDKAALTDALHSPFWGLGKQRLWNEDRRLRGDRLALQDDALGQLDAGGDGREFWQDFDICARRLAAAGMSRAYVQEQQAAYYLLLDVMDTAERFACSDDVVVDRLLEAARFSCTRVLWPDEADDATASAGEPGRQPQVRIMAQHRAAQLPEKSAHTVVVCDLTTESYPLRESRSAAAALLRRLGAGPRDTALARARRSFAALVRVPTRRLVLERCLNNPQADPLYPSAMLEELAAAYAEPATDSQALELEELYRLPAALLVNRYERGEEDLVADLRPRFRNASCAMEEVPAASPDRAALTPDPLRLSASQLESYLDCPYKWFVSNRLGASDIDEWFGPREIGSFLHEVFQTFYAEFGKKVTPQNLSEAQQLMFGSGGVFDRVVAAQHDERHKGPRTSRLVALPGTSEGAEIDYLRGRVDQWLSFETTFLPGFTPVAFECVIPRVPYEGCLVKGVIDRIDMDERGRAVVIDYKGSLSPLYQPLKGEEFKDDGKVQALMYARILEEAGSLAFRPAPEDGGLTASYVAAGDYEAEPADQVCAVTQVVGALYVSYNKDNHVRGAYDATVIGVGDIPTLKAAGSCALAAEGDLSFEAAQDHAAARVRQAVLGIAAGQVDPNPSGNKACDYCPVTTCGKRWGNGTD